MKYFYKVESWGSNLISIEGTNSTHEYLTGSNMDTKLVFKTTIKDIIKDYGHKSTKDYIKRLKYMGYKEVTEVEQLEDYINEYDAAYKQYKLVI